VNALGRLGRKRRDRRVQLEDFPQFAVTDCECLVDGDFALLRLTGTGINPPASLVADHDSPQSFEPLPGSDTSAPGGSWRAAFAIPAEVAEPGTLLWLLDGGEYMTDVRVPSPAVAPLPSKPKPVAEEPELPAGVAELVADAKPMFRTEAKPAPAAQVAPTPPAPAPADVDADDPRAKKLVEAWSEAAALREKLSDREEDLSRALQELLAARTDVDPLRERAARLTEALEAARAERSEELEAASAERAEALEAAYAAHARATELEADLEAVRAELASVEPRLTEARQRTEHAEEEAATLRSEVDRLEAELSVARSQNEATASAAADQQRAAEGLQEELEKLKEQPKSRRRGFGRRSEDSEVNEVRTELEARIAEQQERIEQLEQETASFAERRDEAIAESLRERVGELEEELRQHVATGEDLRALLDSERELLAGARVEVRDLKEQLATASAKRAAVAEAVRAATPPPAEASSESDDASAPAAVEPPPWSALDDELLARIEKAKALTG
jgi:predicted  nucleic acid-binding Zn-ribbon protein